MYKLDWFIQTSFFELSNRISRRRNKTKLVLTFKTFNEKNEVSYKVLIFLTVIISVYFNETKKMFCLHCSCEALLITQVRSI